MDLLAKLQPTHLHSVLELTGMRPKDPKKTPWPLFRFGITKDCMFEFSILDKIYVRCFRNLVEAVIVEGVRSSDVAVLSFFINHVDARVYVNIPTDNEPKKLRHIANAYSKPTVQQLKELTRAMIASIVKYPTRVVVETKFQTVDSIFNSDLTNPSTIRKLGDKFAGAMGSSAI